MATQFKVTNGPSQMDLMLAFFDPYPFGQARTVTFTLQGAKPADHKVAVFAVERGPHGPYLNIKACCLESGGLIMVTNYSLKKRTGRARVEEHYYNPPGSRALVVPCDGCGENSYAFTLEMDPESDDMLCHDCLTSRQVFDSFDRAADSSNSQTSVFRCDSCGKVASELKLKVESGKMLCHNCIQPLKISVSLAEPTDSSSSRPAVVLCDGCGENAYAFVLEKDPQSDDMLCHDCLESRWAWTCDWCGKSSRNHEVSPCQTYDGETICPECYQRDEEGPQVARYGIDSYDVENEPERIIDADGNVYYE